MLRRKCSLCMARRELEGKLGTLWLNASDLSCDSGDLGLLDILWSRPLLKSRLLVVF